MKILADVWHVINQCWYVCIINVSACGEGDWCQSLFLCDLCWCLLCFALLIHYDDLSLCETLSVQFYETCDSASITVIQTACLHLQDNSFFNYRSVCTNCWPYLCERVCWGQFWCCLFVFYCFVCVQEKEYQTSGSSRLWQQYIRWLGPA